MGGFGAHLGKKQHVLNGLRIRQKHDEPVDADAHPAGRRHAVLERPQEILVDEHRLVIAARAELQLVLEPGALVVRVVQLAVAVREFRAVEHELEALGVAGSRPGSR